MKLTEVTRRGPWRRESPYEDDAQAKWRADRAWINRVDDKHHNQT